jgi:hypothetical protein
VQAAQPMSVDGKATLGSATLSYGTMISDGMMGALNTAGTYDPTGMSSMVNTAVRVGLGVDSPTQGSVDGVITVAAAMVPGGNATKKGLGAGFAAWKRVGIDMEHIVSGHTATGNRAIQSGGKSLFPSSWGERQIESAIRQAYRQGENIGSKGGRSVIQGEYQGVRIEMLYNRQTRRIETAYPKN